MDEMFLGSPVELTGSYFDLVGEAFAVFFNCQLGPFDLCPKS